MLDAQLRLLESEALRLKSGVKLGEMKADLNLEIKRANKVCTLSCPYAMLSLCYPDISLACPIPPSHHILSLSYSTLPCPIISLSCALLSFLTLTHLILSCPYPYIRILIRILSHP